ncbi:hypothetical protein L6R52_07320 [Myxococcota bacterium]|nr:hypothetical protein [Myxococcota bacterium]
MAPAIAAPQTATETGAPTQTTEQTVKDASKQAFDELQKAEDAKAAEAAKTATSSTAAAVEATPAETKPADVKPAETKPADATAADAAATAATTAPADQAATAKADDKKAADSTVNVDGSIGAGVPAGDPKKPWRVGANASLSIGQGTFVGAADTGNIRAFSLIPGSARSLPGSTSPNLDASVNSSQVSWAVQLTGSYRLDPKLTLGASLAFDQLVTNSLANSGTTPYPNQIFFRDLNFTATSPSLYTEELTGIRVGASAGISLGVSMPTMSQEIIGSGRLGASLTRAFENVGPGTLTLQYSLGYRHNVGPETRSIDGDEWASAFAICRAYNRESDGSCKSSLANPTDLISNSFAVSYDFLEKWSLGLSFALQNSIAARLDDSEITDGLAAGPDIEVGRSIYATGDVNYSAVTTTSIELGYAINQYLVASAGLSTAAPPYIQDGNNSRRLRFPFWDFENQRDSLSSFYLSVAASY